MCKIVISVFCCPQRNCLLELLYYVCGEIVELITAFLSYINILFIYSVYKFSSFDLFGFLNVSKHGYYLFKLKIGIILL